VGSCSKRTGKNSPKDGRTRQGTEVEGGLQTNPNEEESVGENQES
jgi:hypothetical protein